jgi:hypothetical protein
MSVKLIFYCFLCFSYLKVGQNQSIIKQQYAKYMYDFVANQNPVGNVVALNFILSR